MEFLFDTANLNEIEQCGTIYPYTGVTSNPTILAREGEVDFFAHMNKMRRIIGDRTLHIQTTAKTADGIAREADALRERIDADVFIKVPATEQGLLAISQLKSRGFNVTATAVYNKLQGICALLAGADYVTVYCNRMQNLDIDSSDVIYNFRECIEQNGLGAKVLSASFKNAAQVVDSFAAGAHAATVAPAILRDAFASPLVEKAVGDFAADWEKLRGGKTIAEL